MCFCLFFQIFSWLDQVLLWIGYTTFLFYIWPFFVNYLDQENLLHEAIIQNSIAKYRHEKYFAFKVIKSIKQYNWPKVSWPHSLLLTFPLQLVIEQHDPLYFKSFIIPWLYESPPSPWPWLQRRKTHKQQVCCYLPIVIKHWLLPLPLPVLGANGKISLWGVLTVL